MECIASARVRSCPSSPGCTDIESSGHETVEIIRHDSNRSSVDTPRPVSPCDSEISVGCEDDQKQGALVGGDGGVSSPMEMVNFTTDGDDEEEDTEVEPQSPSTSRGGPSPALSSVSVHTESLTYLSDDEYFRPLKRLAMSSGSPTPSDRPQSSSPRIPPRVPQSTSPPEMDSNSRISAPVSSPNLIDASMIKKSSEDEFDNDHDEDPTLQERSLDDNMDKNNSGLRSFSILDILSYKPSRRKSTVPVKIVRPWDSSNRDLDDSDQQGCPQDIQRVDPNRGQEKVVSEGGGKRNDKGGALDALFKMTNKTLDNLNKEDKTDASSIFNNRQPPKKKRKSRTAFTNHQIFELEKRFLYQKYLSPADRDDLSQSLGLSNAQVITWFQNRRAKLKRDMEELKRDVENAKAITTSAATVGLGPGAGLGPGGGGLGPELTTASLANKTLLEASVNMAAFIKAREMPKVTTIVTLPR